MLFLFGGGPGIDSSRVASAALTLRAPSLRSRVHIAGAICRTPAGILIPVLKQKSTPRGAFIVWRWARDSNPGNLSVQRFSRPPLSTTQPAHLNCLRSVAPRKTAIIPRSESDTRRRIKFKQILFPHCLLLRRVGRFAPAVCHEECTAVQVAAHQRPVSARSESLVTLLVWAVLADR